MAPPFQVAVFLYNDADPIDFMGPMEIYISSQGFGPEPKFKITTFSHQNPVRPHNAGVSLIPDETLSSIASRISDFDILVVPGTSPDVIDKMLASEDGPQVTGLIKNFSELPPRKETGRRILQSVCTGSVLLAAADVLRGRTVTTHHMFYDALPAYADKAAGGESGVKVVKKRWVHAGKTEGDVEIVTAGGVSSGFDATLFIVELLAGKEAAATASEITEFEARGEHAAWGVGK